MASKKRIYIILLVVWLLGVFSCAKPLPLAPAPTPTPTPLPTPTPVPPASAIDIPEGPPVITANASYVMRGEFNFLFIYGDGSIIYIEEKGLRMPSREHPPTRTWKTGKLQEEELNSLLEFIKNSGFEELEDSYKFPGKPIEGGGTSYGDMDYAVSIDYGDLHKTVYASHYLTPDGGMSYPDMPYPLNEIYKKLKNIAENQAEEVYRESIQSSLLWE